MPTSSCRRRFGWVCWGLLSALAVGGCGGASTQYYFAAADLDEPGVDGKPPADPHLTFYRVTFKGDSFGVKSTLQQGFYDANALHQLFGEVSKPAKDADDAKTAGNTVNVGEFTLRFDPVTRRWDVPNHRERFTIMYGVNADAMAQQAQAFADNDELGKQVGQIFADSLKRKAKTETPPADDADKKALKAAQAAATKVAKKLDATATGLADDAAPNDVRAALVVAAQDLLTTLGSAETLDKANPDAAVKRAGVLYDELSKKKTSKSK